MTILKIIFWTPIPMIFAIFLLFTMWKPNGIRAKIIGSICVLIVILNVYYWTKAFDAKLASGNQKGQALLITKLNDQVNKLIYENRADKAQAIILKFNARYPLIADDRIETKNLIDELIKESQ